METSNGYSVRIFMPSGSPDGLRIIEKSNWTGIGFAFPRDPVDAMREAWARPEMQRAGVYILWGPGEDEHRPPQAYVGMSDCLHERLSTHAGKSDLEFWSQTVAFTSKDGYFNVAHARYVESRLVSLAKSIRCDLKNGNNPNEPSLAEADIADAASFLRDMLSCLPLVGVDFFASTEHHQDVGYHAATTERLNLLQLRRGGVVAAGYVDGSKFIVREGATAAKRETTSIPLGWANHRADLIKRGILIEDGDFYRLTQDTLFNSPSLASGVMLGASSNGREEWKNADGQSLNQIESAALAE